MPYSDPVAQRRYQREHVAARRATYLADKSCIDCGADECLELDHVRGEKADHRMWSWAAPRLAVELAKCDVRCRTCHQARHGAERVRHGIKRYGRGCRCDECRKAKSVANARHRESRPERDSNSCERLCRPPRSHSAIRPETKRLAKNLQDTIGVSGAAKHKQKDA